RITIHRKLWCALYFFHKLHSLTIKSCTVKKVLLFFTLMIALSLSVFSQEKNNIAVIGYFAGRSTALDSFPIQKLTHLIFSFCHLHENKLWVDHATDTACIQKMVSFKQKYPSLKIILSLGGWGGCKDCSEAFSTRKGRKTFARSTRYLMEYFHTDGIDLDWEYPVIAGYPGHLYSIEDKENFTALIKTLRKKLGKKYEISFAAGGFSRYIDSSIDWKKVIKNVDKVNLMTYDLVHGASKVSGHHTPLYSTQKQIESTDNAVNRLISAGVPSKKIILGAAFYGRMFEVTDTINNGLYLPASFYHGISYSRLYDSVSVTNGFVQYWDSVANAPYAFNVQRKIQVTYDDSLSIARKTEYVIKKNLGGIMFWQLMDDRFTDGLLDVIDKTKTTFKANGQ
ncbi:MAG TPA: glycoside hydrolase family 18 protein, partial [Chitinophagaceae bacterium]